jgi:hypothetical protein
MTRALLIVALCGLAVACGSSNETKKSPSSSTGSATGSANVATPAPTPAAPAANADLSGRWGCSWNLPGASGDESWTLMHDGTSINVTLRGKDPGGRYTGSMTGTITDRKLELAYTYNDGTRGTMSLKVSANGKVIDGESVRASAKATPQHYACARDDDGSTAARVSGGGGGGRSAATGDCKKHTGVAYLEDCQQACWAAGSLNEDKCREKCTAWCKPRP